MEIIKQGSNEKIDRPVVFTCNKCGCVFRAKKGEYKTHYSQIDGDWYEVGCPFCGNSVTVDVVLVDRTGY